MPEQPQWSERTLDMPPQDPWAPPPYVAGRATVTPNPRAQRFAAEHEPTGNGLARREGAAVPAQPP